MIQKTSHIEFKFMEPQTKMGEGDGVLENWLTSEKRSFLYNLLQTNQQQIHLNFTLQENSWICLIPMKETGY